MVKNLSWNHRVLRGMSTCDMTVFSAKVFVAVRARELKKLFLVATFKVAVLSY